MAITAQIHGIKASDTATTIASLKTKLGAARAGASVALTPTIAAAVFDPVVNKQNPGVTAVFNSDQVLQTSLIGCSGINIIGGIHSGDTLAGDVTGNVANISIDINNSSRIAILGAILEQGWLAVYSRNGSTDILIDRCLMKGARGDVINFSSEVRAKITRCVVREGARNETMQWYNNGTAPIDIAIPGVGNPGYGTTNFIADPGHNDWIQTLTAQSHMTVTLCNVRVLAQGYWGAGMVTAFGLWEDNVILSADANGFNVTGSDLTVSRNSVGPHPLYNTFANATTFEVYRDGSGKIQGYGNANLASGQSVLSPSGVNLSSLSMNGDSGVTLPTDPQVTAPRWLSYSVPTYVEPTTASVTIPPVIYHTNASGGATAAAGTRFTCDLAWVMNRQIIIGQEWRWTAGGTPIGGATGRTFNSTGRSAAEVIRCETRVQTAVGYSAWVASSNSVTLT